MGLAFDTRRGAEELLERDETLATLAEAVEDAMPPTRRIALPAVRGRVQLSGTPTW